MKLSKAHRQAISRGRRGIKFTKSHREAIRRSRLGTHPSDETRLKLKKIHQALAAKPSWRKKVSERTKQAMYRPTVRRKHLAGLRRAWKKHGFNFRGGNGQRPVKFVRKMWKVLRPLGYIKEYAIGVPGYRIRNYKVDFALVHHKVAIECDGPSHHSRESKLTDKRKNVILRALGWKVIRVPHD